MEWFEALLLGIIQGLTEYLPVSSSGHLELGKLLLGIDLSQEDSPFGITFNVVLHLATVLSTVVVLRKDIWDLLKGLLQFKLNDEFWFAVKIVVSMIPAALIGLLYQDVIDETFTGSALLVGLMLLITGILLFLADKAKVTERDISIGQALIIGIAQAIALAPGISRSGATISTSVLLKIDKDRAARFSFLMVIPLILGKVAKDVLDGELALGADTILPMGLGFLAAFVVGIVACRWMLSLVKNSKLVYFSLYCFLVGGLAIGYECLA